ncbi:MAG: T9SS type A sorting domain-containing protein, partial [Rhodothermales bacterium]
YDGDYGLLELPVTVAADGVYTLSLLQENDGSAPDPDFINFFIDDVSLTPVPPGLAVTVSPESGTVDADGSENLTVTVDASGLAPGLYEYEITITTNSTETPTLTVPLSVEVLPTVANEGDAVPTAFALEPAYPNPFAGSTTIRYALPEAARVTVEVYDAVGRRVAVLVDGEMAAGSHEAEWDAASMASGVYLYRMQAGDFTKTLKVSLVR